MGVLVVLVLVMDVLAEVLLVMDVAFVAKASNDTKVVESTIATGSNQIGKG